MTAAYPEYIGSLYAWKEGAEGSESLVDQISKSVSGHAWYLLIAKDIWHLDSLLKSFIGSINQRIENSKQAPTTQAVTKEQALEVATRFKSLYADIEKTYSNAKRHDLTNRTLTGVAFNSVKQRSEELLDIAENIELAVSGAANTIFAETMDEYRRGEHYGLDQIGK